MKNYRETAINVLKHVGGEKSIAYLAMHIQRVLSVDKDQ